MMTEEKNSWRATSLNRGPDILIIGIGNEYRGDDGIGLCLAHRLKEKNLPGTIVETYCGEGIGLMELWKSYTRVFLLDAVHSDAPPGKIYRFNTKLRPFPSCWVNHSTHNFCIAETIELAKALDLLPHYMVIYGIAGTLFKRGDGISPEVRAAAGEVVERIIVDINNLLTGYNPRNQPGFYATLNDIHS